MAVITVRANKFEIADRLLLDLERQIGWIYGKMRMRQTDLLQAMLPEPALASRSVAHPRGLISGCECESFLSSAH
jgi:hypothetical protein